MLTTVSQIKTAARCIGIRTFRTIFFPNIHPLTIIHLLFTRNGSIKKEIQKKKNQKIHNNQKRKHKKPICIVGYFHNILRSVIFPRTLILPSQFASPPAERHNPMGYLSADYFLSSFPVSATCGIVEPLRIISLYRYRIVIIVNTLPGTNSTICPASSSSTSWQSGAE